MIQGAWGWCTGMTQTDGMGREVRVGLRMGNTYISMVDSCQCMAKAIQYCKVNNNNNKIKGEKIEYMIQKKKIHLRCRRHVFDPWVGNIPWRRKWQLAPVFLPGKFYGQRSLVGYSPQGHKQSDTTERLSMSIYLCAYVILIF